MCGRMYEIKIRLPKQIALTISFEYVAIDKEIPRQAFLPISVSLLPRFARVFNSIFQLSLRTHAECGCFFCLKTFNPDEITNWISDKRGAYSAMPVLWY